MLSTSKCVVVTGGAKGIGLATALAFTRKGDWVFAVDSDLEALRAVPMGIVQVFADLSDPAGVESACQQILSRTMTVDILVNNAGIGGEWKGILETSVDEWDRVVNTNLRAAFLMSKLLIPSMPANGNIVNVASTRALMSEPNTEPYSASKGGLVALTHALAISLSERHLRVNCVSPGWIDVTGGEQTLTEEDHEQHPAKRVGTPDDVASAIVYLASDVAGFVTGANLIIDGGMTRKMIYAE